MAQINASGSASISPFPRQFYVPQSSQSHSTLPVMEEGMKGTEGGCKKVFHRWTRARALAPRRESLRSIVALNYSRHLGRIRNDCTSASNLFRSKRAFAPGMPALKSTALALVSCRLVDEAEWLTETKKPKCSINEAANVFVNPCHSTFQFKALCLALSLSSHSGEWITENDIRLWSGSCQWMADINGEMKRMRRVRVFVNLFKNLFSSINNPVIGFSGFSSQIFFLVIVYNFFLQFFSPTVFRVFCPSYITKYSK